MTDQIPETNVEDQDGQWEEFPEPWAHQVPTEDDYYLDDGLNDIDVSECFWL